MRLWLLFCCAVFVLVGLGRLLAQPFELLVEAEKQALDGRFADAAESYREGLTALRRLPPAELGNSMPEADLAIRRLAALGESSADREPAKTMDVLLAWSELSESVDPLVASLARYHAGWTALRSGEGVERARQLWKPLAFLRSWRVVGPFDNERGGGFQTAYAPEKDLDLEAEFEGKKRPISWRRLPRPALAGLVDLDALFVPNDEALAYALSFVRAGEAAEVALRFGTDEGYRIWVNGSLVASEDVHRSEGFDQTVVGVRLREGWNSILFKVSEAKGAWALRVRLTRPDGKPLDSAEVSIAEDEPPPEALAELAQLVRTAYENRREREGSEGMDSDVSCHRGVETSLLERLEAQPADARAHYLLGAILRQRAAHDVGEHPDREHCSRAVGIDPGPALYHYELARTHERETALAAQRDDNAWRDSLEEAESRGSALASFLLARYYFSTFQNLSQAERYTSRSLERNPGFGRAWLLLGDIQSAMDFPLARRRAILRAKKSAPGSSETLLSLAQTSVADGQPEEAKVLLRQVLEWNRLDGRARSPLVDVLLDDGQDEEARRWIEEEMTLNPYATSPYEKLARLALGRDDPGQAVEHLEKALEISPEDHRLVEEKGRAFWELGRRDEALRAWESALALQPNLPELRERLEVVREASAPFEDEFRQDAAAIIAAARQEVYEPAEGEAARILLDLRAVEVHRDGTTREFVQQIVEVLNDRGVRGFDTFDVYYASGEQVLEFKRGRVVHPDGSQEDAQLPRFGSGSADTEVSRRRARIDLPPLAVGDIVEVEYVREDIVQSFFGDYFGRQELFQTDYPIRKKVFLLRVPAERRFYFRQRNLAAEPEVGGTAGAEASDGKYVTYTWTVENVARVDAEPAMPPETEVLPVLEVSTFEDWDAFAEWYWNLIRKQFEASPEIVRKVAELTSGKEGELERIRALYNFVVTDIRYNVWPFGVHGFKPYNASAIFTRRFGDCKDKATLLSVMLDEVGIPCYPVLIRALQLRGEEDLTLPMVNHFNHCISYVPARGGRPELYLDGTAQGHSVDELPSMDRGARVLVVRPDGGEVRQIPWNVPDALSSAEEWNVTLASDLSARARVRVQPRGDFAVYVRRRYEIAAQRRTRLQEHFGVVFAGAQVSDESFSELTDLDTPVRMALDLKVPRLVERAPEGLVLGIPDDFFASTRALATFGALEERNYDILVGNPRRSQLRVVFQLPEGWRVKSLPPARRLESRFGRFVLSFERPEPGKLVLERLLELTSARIRISDYEKFREFAASVDDLKHEKIFLDEN